MSKEHNGVDISEFGGSTLCIGCEKWINYKSYRELEKKLEAHKSCSIYRRVISVYSPQLHKEILIDSKDLSAIVVGVSP